MRAIFLTVLLTLALAGCSGTTQTKLGPAEPVGRAPANGPIAFERYAGPEQDDGPSRIWLRMPDSTSRALTGARVTGTAPAWSPDGTRIAFERAEGDEGARIWSMKADGAGAQPLASGCATARRCLADSFPSYSPDGRRVSFERTYGPLVRHNDEHSDTWYQVAARVDLMVVDSRGGAPRSIATWGRDTQPWEGAPRWSPDGKHIVLPLGTLQKPTGHTDVSTALFVMDAGGGPGHRITSWDLGAASPDWSPDGTGIVFNSEGGHSRGIYVVRPDGRALRRLLHGGSQLGPGGEGIAPRWSPDGRQIVFATEPNPCSSAHVGGCDNAVYTFDLSVMNADGSGIRDITSAPEFEGRPAWGARPR